MMRYCLMIWILINGFMPVFGAFEQMIIGARQAGLSGASVAMAGSIDAMHLNPAAIAEITTIQMHSSFSRPFDLEGLHLTSASAGLRTQFGGLGMGAVSFGQSLYRETTLHLCWAAQIYPNVHFGIQARLAQLQIQRYGSANALLLDLGMIYSLTPQIHFGFTATNLNQARLGVLDDPLPQVTQWGFGYQPHASTLFCLDLVKDVRFPLEIRGGVEYHLLPALALRSGFGQEPSSVSMGLGIHLFRADLDYAYTHHPVLGGTHQVSVRYRLR